MRVPHALLRRGQPSTSRDRRRTWTERLDSRRMRRAAALLTAPPLLVLVTGWAPAPIPEREALGVRGTAIASQLADPGPARPAGRLERLELAARAREIQPSRSQTRRELSPARPAWLSRCRGRDTGKAHPNGRVPVSELCRLPVRAQHLLHPDSAEAWWRLDRRYRARFGGGICVTDSYRSVDAQQHLYAAKPGLAAYPGTSNHGWGVALDLCGGVQSYATRTHRWLRANGPALGWNNPRWARESGSRPEPWHWEYANPKAAGRTARRNR